MIATSSKSKEQRLGGIGDAAVEKRTGKTWAQWLKLLDKAGAKKLTHAEIAAYLNKKCGLSSWWSQMVTVGYEQARGRRVKYQTATGFQSSVSKTVAVPLKELYEAWEDSSARAAWLGKERMNIRKATARKSMRITWSDGATSLEVNFYSKSARRSQVVVQHTKLESAKAVEQSKSFWAHALGRLKTQLEG
jgi:hypothetical protein